MQHSQLRKPNEPVKLFAKASSQQQKSLLIYEFNDNGTLSDITPIGYQIDDLNTGYFSTEIITPDHSCYLVIQFCGNPIILRVGEPELQFFFWAPKQKTYTYFHYDEFGTKLDEGELKALGLGFYYTTPISDTLGYIEVLGKPYVIHVPYCSGSVGVGIDIDWRRTIKRQQFGLEISKLNFKLNKREYSFTRKTKEFKFNLRIRKQNHSVKTNKLNFKIECRG
jgi:hypothetical protein